MKLNEYIEITNEDNMELMKRYPDKYFSLAIIDPPYGILNKTKRGGQRSPHKYKVRSETWDYMPKKEYWNELFRISKNQIVWGANHFISKLPIDSSCWIVWDKENGNNDFADCELAWTSFKTAVRKFKWKWHGMLQQNMKEKQERIHPNEKPIQLYEWLLKNYANNGDKIIDTHFGSGSIALAVDKVNKLDKMNLHLTGIEKDTFYYDKAIHRISQKLSIGTLSF